MKTLPRTDVAIVGGGWAGLLMAKELGARTGHVRGGAGTRRAAQDGRLFRRDGRAGLRHTPSHDAGCVERDGDVPVHAQGSGDSGAPVRLLHAGNRHRRRRRALERDRCRAFCRTASRSTRAPWSAMAPGGCRPIIRFRTGASRRRSWSHSTRVPNGCWAFPGKTGLDPFEGPRSAEYPTPPKKMAYFSTLFSDAARSLGYHPFPSPSAKLSTAYRNPDGIVRPGCDYCGFCDRFGCMMGAKAQPTNTLMPVIARQKSVTVRMGAEGAARAVQRREGHGRILHGRQRRRDSSAGRPGDAGLVDPQQHAPAAAFRRSARRTTRPAAKARSAATSRTRRIPAGRALFRPAAEPLHGLGGSGVAIRDLDGDCFDHGPLDFIRGAYIAALATATGRSVISESCRHR